MKTLHLFVLTCLLLSTATAEMAPRSPEELEKGAEAIVTATVSKVDVTTTGFFLDQDWQVALQLKVDSVVKGDQIKSGDDITVRCWKMKSRPAGWAGPSGHSSIPDNGAKVKLWLRPNVEQGDWSPLLPNGIELTEGALLDFRAIPQSRMMLWIVTGAFVVVIGLVLVLRANRKGEKTS